MSNLYIEIKKPKVPQRSSGRMREATSDAESLDGASCCSSSATTNSGLSTLATSTKTASTSRYTISSSKSSKPMQSTVERIQSSSPLSNLDPAAPRLSKLSSSNKQGEDPPKRASQLNALNPEQSRQSIHLSKSPLKELIDQAKSMKIYAVDAPVESPARSSSRREGERTRQPCEKSVESEELSKHDMDLSSHDTLDLAVEAPRKQYPPTSFRMDTDVEPDPKKKYAPGSPLHAPDLERLRLAKAAASKSAKVKTTVLEVDTSIISYPPSASLPSGSDRGDPRRGRRKSRSQGTSDRSEWSGHSVVPAQRRRRSSLQRMKDAAAHIVDDIKEGSEKIRHSIAARVDSTYPKRQPHSSHTAPNASTASTAAKSTTTDTQSSFGQSEPSTTTVLSDATNAGTKATLPSAAEVYGTPTYFTLCPHTSPPAHTPLNAPLQRVRLTSKTLAYPTFAHRQHLVNQKPLTINIIPGRCAPCDLHHHRALETESLRAWNRKHETFSRRLRQRRTAYRSEWAAGMSKDALRAAGREKPIRDLEAKLAEVERCREADVIAIWSGWKAKWGVSPAGIVPQSVREEWEVGLAESPVKSIKAPSSEDGAGAITGVGFMRNGRHGGPMDSVREPGRMMLSWDAPEKMLRASKDWVVGMGREFSRAELELLAREPWEEH